MSYIELPPRMPIRFISEQAELLKSQTEQVDVEKSAKEEALRELYRKRAISEETMNKSMEVLSGGHAGAGTDAVVNETIPEEQMRAQFRAPGDRNLSNILFRRNPDASLDLEAAKHVVVDAVHRACDSAGVEGTLNDLDKMVLSVFFPGVYMYVDQALIGQIAAVHMRLAPFEIEQVRHLVAHHLQGEMSYNAGNGGFPTPHERR